MTRIEIDQVKLQAKDWAKLLAAFITLFGYLINLHVDTSSRLSVAEATIVRLERSVDRLVDKVEQIGEDMK